MTFPETLPGPVTALAVAGADRRGDAAGDGTLEELPQAAAGQAQAADLVGAPDAERAPAAATCLAVAAKDPPGADRGSPGTVLVIAAQITVPDQRADRPVVRTRRQL